VGRHGVDEMSAEEKLQWLSQNADGFEANGCEVFREEDGQWYHNNGGSYPDEDIVCLGSFEDALRFLMDDF
jgi:hypothetical protein